MLDKVDELVSTRLPEAVRFYWLTRRAQSIRQQSGTVRDTGARSEATGGAQMNGFVSLLTDIAISVGISRNCIHVDSYLQLPGYFRPTKKWDLIIIVEGVLVAAIETKSQIGPSFGNNFNNRTEEAMGSALDVWTAYREGAFGNNPSPFLGYLFMLEDCPKVWQPVRVDEPHFKVFDVFRNASYAVRYKEFCRRLLHERQYTSTCFLMSGQTASTTGMYLEPAEDLSFSKFARSFASHAIQFS